ncbi:ATP-grasp ribosomal peptide maturase [Saccharomonospora halophila]|uniref:ATP-grasp ribosomal peptide maturase n=1 Tax=Saccharomonospora halophila TaxID=129922 RepID=UPI00037A7952|nr:ATP-grasp ribosomal peptide maturase [Saccharomonospora halophila]
MSILVLADEHDASADVMVRALEDRDAVVHRVDTAWFPRRLSIAAELAGGRWCGWLRTPHRTIDLDGITSVWFRSPRTYRFPDSMTGAERSFAHLEAKYGLGGVLTSLPVRWVNHPARVADAAYKPVQLATARRCGLHVPDTLITNEPEQVLRFTRNRSTVSKVLGANSIVEQGGRKIAFTRLLDDADRADLTGLSQTTHLFQQWVDKAYEVRVIVIGDFLTAFTIHAGSAASQVDWRADYAHLSYDTCDTPEDVASGITKLMRTLGLLYGALDFVVSPEGEWTFLEVNAGGQYGWLEHHTGAPLTARLADLLVRPVGHR